MKTNFGPGVALNPPSPQRELNQKNGILDKVRCSPKMLKYERLELEDVPRP